MSTILAVDDEPDIRLFVRLMLRRDGHDVVEATDGDEVAAAVQAHRPDLILLDVMMPRMSGWDVLAELKAAADPDVREIPVVLLTALGGPLDRVKGGIEGAVRYLAKPIGDDELRSTVADALAGEPEPAQRRRAQRQALGDLVRLETGEAAVAPVPRLRLARLEGHRPSPAAPPPPPEVDLGGLTPKQRELLDAVRRAPTVLEAAADLGMSRSNVYASLRRIARRLDIRDATDLLALVRDPDVRWNCRS